jgi:hypothetical protein
MPGMEVTVHIPDDLALRLGGAGELQRRALEALAIEEFRRGHLTEPELQWMLDFGTRVKRPDFPGAQDRGASGAMAQSGSSPASVPPVLDEASRARARQAAADIIARGKGITLGGLDLKALIDEGRP